MLPRPMSPKRTLVIPRSLTPRGRAAQQKCVGDLFAIRFGNAFISDWTQVRATKQLKPELLQINGWIQGNGDIHQTETDGALPNGTHKPAYSRAYQGAIGVITRMNSAGMADRATQAWP